MNLAQKNTRVEAKLTKKPNFTESDLETHDHSSKLINKSGYKIEEDEFWNDCSKNLETEIRPIMYFPTKIELVKQSHQNHVIFQVIIDKI